MAGRVIQIVSKKKKGPLLSTQLTFKAIVVYWEKMGFSPSIRDLVQLTELSSTAAIHYHLNKLEQLGYIKRMPKIARSIVVKRDLTELEEDDEF